MAIRGETIGSAYVRILADGSKLDQSIKQAWDKAEPTLHKVADEQGRKFAEDWHEGFRDRMDQEANKDITFKSLIASAHRGAGDFAATGSVFSKNFMKDLRKELRKLHTKELGNLMFAEILDGIETGRIKTREQLRDMLEDQNQLITKATLELQKAEQEQFRQAAKETERIAKEMTDRISQQAREATARQSTIAKSLADANKKHLKKIEDDWRITTNNISTNIRTINATAQREFRATRDILSDVRADVSALDKLIEADERKLIQVEKDIIKAQADWDKQMKSNVTEMNKLTKSVKDFTSGANAGIGDRKLLIDHVDQLTDKMKEYGQTDKITSRTLRHLRRDVILANPTLDRFSSKIDRTSDALGRAFGRGSRNNFLNFFGSLVRGFTRIIKIGPKILGFFSDIFRLGVDTLSQLTKGFNDAREAGNNFAQSLYKGLSAAAIGAFEAIATGGTSLVAGLIILTTTIEIVIVTLGVLVSTIILVIGWITALASAITFALIGALAALLGALTPVVFAIGGIVAGITGMDKALKKTVKESLKPFKELWEDIGGIVARNMFADFPDQMDRLHDALDTSGLRSLARGIGDALSNVIDMFVAVVESPAYHRFIAEMGKTMPEQIELLGSIGSNAFKGMLGVIRALTPITRRFLKWVDGLVEDFAEWANTKKGQKELREFFRKAADSAEALGDFLWQAFRFFVRIIDKGREPGNDIFEKMADKIAEIVEWLSSKEGQKALDTWFEDAKDLGDQIGYVVEQIAELIDELDTPENRKMAKDFFGFIGDTIGFISRHWDDITKMMIAFNPLFRIVWAMIELWKAIKKVWHWLKEAKNDIEAFVHRTEFRIRHLKEFIEEKWEELKDDTEEAWDDMKNLIKRKINEAIDWVKDKFRDGFEYVRGKATDLKNWVVGKFWDIVNFVRSLPERIGKVADKFFERGKEFGKNLWDGLMQGIRDAGDWAGEIAGDIGDALLDLINGLIDKLNDAIPNSLGWGKVKVDIDEDPIPHISLAAGGIFDNPTMARIGEAGSEAVVPLNRPLSLVDPAVRELSAIAQGLAEPGSDRGRARIEVGGITVITPTKNPVAVAQETVNAMAATGYF